MADRFRFGRFELQRIERRVLLDGAPVNLGARGIDLLLALVDHRDRVVSKAELLDLAWSGLVVEEANVQVQVSALRKALGADVIATVGGIGYRWAVPVEPLGLVPQHNLPAERTGFVGREAVLKEARQQLSRSRLLTLVGIGGIGKTRLAMKLAHSALTEHRHGARWADLAPLSTAEQLESAVADAVGCRLQGQDAPFATMAAHCRDLEMLLVLDNCEHMLAAVRAGVDALLAGAPRLQILVTSREALHATGEQLFPVRPLEVPAADSRADEVMGSESVRLFVDRARNSMPGLAIDADSAPLLAAICRRLDGLPLALELAAARMRLVSAAQLLALLDQRFELLTAGPAAVPRQASLLAMIRWSYEAANPDAQRALCAISVCAGGCDLEALTALLEPEATATSVTDSLAQLLDTGLVWVDHRHRRPRFLMLETVGQYAVERMRHSGQLDRLQDLHRDHFLRLAEQADWHQRGVWDREVIDRLRIEHDNLVRAMSRCESQDDAPYGLRFAVALRAYWAKWGLLRLGRDLTLQALARDGAQRPDALRSAAARALAQPHWWLGEAAQARGAGEESLAIAVQLNDLRLMGQACRTLSYAYGLSGQLDEAGRSAKEALRLARLLDNPIDLVAALNAVADHLAESGDLARAADLHEEVFRVREMHGDMEGQGSAALSLADIAIDLEALDRARKWLLIAGRLEAMTQSRHIGQHLVEHSAALAAHAGSAALAVRWYSASARHRQSTGLSDLTMSHHQRAAALQRALAALGPAAASDAEQTGLSLDYVQTVREVKDWLATAEAVTAIPKPR